MVEILGNYLVKAVLVAGKIEFLVNLVMGVHSQSSLLVIFG